MYTFGRLSISISDRQYMHAFCIWYIDKIFALPEYATITSHQSRLPPIHIRNRYIAESEKQQTAWKGTEAFFLLSGLSGTAQVARRRPRNTSPLIDHKPQRTEMKSHEIYKGWA